MATSPFAIVEFASAEDLLSALALHRPPWSAYAKDWIFRGHGDAAWSLIPSAFRPESERYYGWNEPYAVGRTHAGQVQNEALLLRGFLRELQAQGVAYPSEGSEALLDVGALWRAATTGEVGPDTWPPKDALPLIGLAQHHGLPTRLLDWSRRPFIAAYFAAIDAAQRAEILKSEDFSLSVWALASWTSSLFRSAGEPYWSVIEPPRASNPNLRAQSGLFTLVVDPSVKPDSAPIPPSIDQLVEDAGPRIIGRSASDDTLAVVSPILIRLDLPASHAWKLLYLLDAEQVSATYLFPGFDGAVRGLREKAYYGAVRFPANWAEDNRPRIEELRQQFVQESSESAEQ